MFFRLGTHLFVKVPRPGDSEVTFSGLPSQAATCYYQSNHSKVEAILLSVLSKDTSGELAGLSPHYFLNGERQAGKLGIQTFKVFWSNSARESNPCLPTMTLIFPNNVSK